MKRAETREDAPSMAGEELLSAFKVASFTLEEDEEVSKLDSITDENTKDWVRMPFHLFLVVVKEIESIMKNICKGIRIQKVMLYAST